VPEQAEICQKGCSVSPLSLKRYLNCQKKNFRRWVWVSQKKGSRVKARYKAKLENGKVFDMAEGDVPFEFAVGKGEVIRGLEEAVIGMKAGDTKNVTMPPEKTFGPRHKELIMKMKKTDFPDDIQLAIGVSAQVLQDGKASKYGVIADINGDTVVLDANHPLAGETLILDVKLVGVD
jgi:FKBP-type peptidyl-prolyl cis-trans isomerase 2